MLLIDEADDLFGETNRGEDRHANVAVAYLLERMEACGGLAMLTPNLAQNIDSAFLRRLGFVVDLLVPTTAKREAVRRVGAESGVVAGHATFPCSPAKAQIRRPRRHFRHPQGRA